jgi:type IV pilus assembly protein PilV
MSPVPERRREAGFTLIEVLIAFLVLSVGLAGVVSLQVMTKASQHQATQRMRAVSLAGQMLDMIRRNPSGMSVYDDRFGANGVGGGTIDAEPTPDCINAACTAAQLAARDLWEWERALDGTLVATDDDGNSGAGLIEPHGCIVFTPDVGKTNSGTVDVILQWRGLQEASDALQENDVVCGPQGGEDGDADGFRRQVVLSSYVADEQEL